MTDKTKGVLSYIFGIIAGFIFLFSNDSSQEVKKHAAQGAVLGVLSFALNVILLMSIVGIPILPIVNMLALACMIIGIVKVCNESNPDIPVLSDIANAIFKSQLQK